MHMPARFPILSPRVRTQRHAPWHLQRISSQEECSLAGLRWDLRSQLSYKYRYRYSGAGIDVYLVDSGVDFNHVEFKKQVPEGFAVTSNFYRTRRFENSFAEDLVGHGTFSGSLIVGAQCGVAKRAKLFSVKVLEPGFSRASPFHTAVGLTWIRLMVQQRRRPAVVSMALNNADHEYVVVTIQALINSGIHVVISAGNEGGSLATSRQSSPIIVGASSILDRFWIHSNYGPEIDIIAPGDWVLGAVANSVVKDDKRKDNKQYDTSSGTSCATPLVAGVVACILSEPENRNITPAQMKALIQRRALNDFLTGAIPPFTKNRLLHNPPQHNDFCVMQ